MPKSGVMLTCACCHQRRPREEFTVPTGGHYMSCLDCRMQDPPEHNQLWKECAREAARLYYRIPVVMAGARKYPR